MKKITFWAFSGILFLVSSCGKVDLGSQLQDQLTLKNGVVVTSFTAHLSGDMEVPSNDSKATGQVVFQLSKDGMELSYKLIVANIENVRMSHIHLGAVGTNGGIVVWLYPPAPPMMTIPGTTNGILEQGVITSDNLTGALAGKTMADLINELKAGNAYVNVHTDQYPGGEIRGQVMEQRGPM